MAVLVEKGSNVVFTDANGKQIFSTSSPGYVSILNSIPAGSNNIGSVTVNESYPSLRYYSATESQPTTNPDGLALVKYSTLWDMSTGTMYSYNGSAWVVIS